MVLTLDLHPVFRNQRDIDNAVRAIVFRGAREHADTVEIITGKGGGTLRARVLATLNQPHLRKLYRRVEVAPGNAGKILVHYR